MQHIWGAVFDWDGVIIDSSAQHEASWERLALEISKPLPQGHFKRGFGMKNEFIIPRILAWTEDPAEITRLSMRKEELYREIVREHGVTPLPGVETWLQRLSDAGIPCVIASSTHRANIEVTLEVLHFARFFTSIVSAEDVTLGKPDPQVFLKAASRIGRVPGCCVVFEDAHAGIQAAKNAGIKVIAVATTNPLAELSNAALAVERLDQLSVEKIDGWFC